MNAMKRIVILCLLIFSALSPSYASGQFFFLKDPLEGKAAPDFTLKTLSGKEMNLTKFREGNAAIIFFWATWCPHCREQFVELNIQVAEIEKKGIKLILVDLDEDVRLVQSYVQKHNIKQDVVLDTDFAVAEKYSIVGVPTFYFIDKAGVIKSVDHEFPDNYAEVLGGSGDKINPPMPGKENNVNDKRSAGTT